MTSAAELLALQEIDLRRDGRRALIADIDSRLGETEALIAARAALAAAETELDRLRRAQQNVETQLVDLDAKIRPMEKRLYDGSVRNPKELSDLQKDLDHHKARRSHLDDEGLTLLDAIEGATSSRSRAQEDLRQAEAEWRRDQERLELQRSQAAQETSRLEDERSKRTAGMDKGTLGLYENLRSLKRGRAVAVIERGACQGCRLTLPTHLVQRVRTGGQLIQCPSCERILVAG
jgi:uncharacterized protein